MTEGSVDVKRL